METKAYLDKQVALKHERRANERVHEQQHARLVHEDVAAFERSRHERKLKQEQSMRAHRDGLIRQIDAHREARHSGAGAGAHEVAINKKIIEEVDTGLTHSPSKRPF